MGDISLNLRFLLWQDEKISLNKDKTLRPNNSDQLSQWPERTSKWSIKLASWLECDVSRAEVLLRDAKMSQMERDNLKHNLALSDEEYMMLVNGSFLDQSYNNELNIWQENIVFLLSKLVRGENGELAQKLSITPGNISKWKSRETEPEKKHKEIIHDFFKLPYQIDLEKFPLFLSIDPIRIRERKELLKKKIDNLTEETLREFFPALERLLERP